MSAIAASDEKSTEVILSEISQQESPCHFSVCISYSFDGGKTFEKLVTEFYVESYINIPLKKEGMVSEALATIEQNKPDMYNVPWFKLKFKDKRHSANDDYNIDGAKYQLQIKVK